MNLLQVELILSFIQIEKGGKNKMELFPLKGNYSP